MMLYVLVAKSPRSGPNPPARAVFLDRGIAQAVADDPREATGWCTTADFTVVQCEVIGNCKPGDPVYAAHQAVGTEGGELLFTGLYSTWDAAGVAAGYLGCSNKLFPQ